MILKMADIHKVYSSIACNLDTNILLASLPLFEKEKVEAIEWSFDTLFKMEEIPSWFSDLVMEFSNNNRLIGHGVYFSLFSGKWSEDQQNWLAKLERISQQFKFDHITEHFGFMTGEDFHKGAPISIPFTQSTLAIGRDRLKRIQQACCCPVGLENLAFSYSLEEVKNHGDFLSKLIEPVNGFIILDLHNLYCQIHNFGISFDDIICLYPLDKVREIHISGGSWEQSQIDSGRQIRRDTHDNSVPDEVFQLLGLAMKKCPNLKYVVLEQLGTALNTQGKRSVFQNDFLRMDDIVQKNNVLFPNTVQNPFSPNLHNLQQVVPLEDMALFKQQVQLSDILENALDYNHAKKMLIESDLRDSAWRVEHWEPFMLETAIAIAGKWKHGF